MNIVSQKSELFIGCLLSALVYGLVVSNIYAVPFTFFQLFTPLGCILLIILGIQNTHIDKGNLLISSVIGVYLLTNIFLKLENYEIENSALQMLAINHASGLIIYYISLSWIATNLNVYQIIKVITATLVPLMILAAFDTLNEVHQQWGRSRPLDLHPNWWGELSIAFSIGALVFNKLHYKIIIYSIALFIILQVQSRSGLVGWLTVIMIQGFYYWNIISKRIKLLFVILCILLTMFTTVSGMLAEFGVFIFNDILMLNDENRGLGTGMSGRNVAIDTAIEDFFNSVMFGNGFDLYTSVHNGYLRITVELGIVFLIGFIILIFRRAYVAFISKNIVILGILTSYCLYVFFQPRMLNLNILSILFFLSLLKWKNDNYNRLERR